MQKTLTDRLADAKALRRSEPEGAFYGYLDTFDGGRNRYALFPCPGNPSPKGTIIFMPGRTEFIEKFFEDIHMFHSLGYACAGFDLRGQGLSHREHADRDKHYLQSFDPHLRDVKQLFDEILMKTDGHADTPGIVKPFILMGHSAGSHVILRFLAAHPGYAEKAITVAPMVRIAAGGVPKFITYSLPKWMIKSGRGDTYVPGHKEFKTGRWGWRKRLTHDDERFEDEDFFIANKDKNLAVGGATYQWLLAALTSTDQLNAPGVAEAIQTPVLMVQASEDKIVDNAAQTEFAARNNLIKLVTIEGAMHEILKERDEKRLLVWQAILPFLDIDLA